MNIKKQRYTSFLKYDGLQESNNNYINNEIINTHPVNNSPPIDYENKCKDFLEYIYIISLNRCINRRELCIKQLELLNIKKYEIVDAVDTTVHSNTHDALYEQVTAKMDKNFIKHNFQKGALGCLLSHLKVIELAKSRNHKHILILEDDFLIINEFYNQLYDHLNNLPNGWDFVYLGKKLWHPTNTYLELHSRLNNINKYFYKPADETFASHAWLIKDTMYDILIQEYNKIDSPVDLCVMRLYNQYNFYACRDDLFITLFDSDIREEDSRINKWNWDVTKYYSEDRRNIIQNIIIYGFVKTGHTHHYIHKMYYDFFKYYYPHLNVIWYDNDEVFYHDHSIIFASPTHYKYKYMPLNSTCFYVFHLDNFEDNSGYKDIESFMAVKDYNDIITGNRGVILLAREQITALNYFQEDSRSKTICLPWFSNVMYQDIAKIRNNLEQIYDDRSSKKYLCFMGSVWYVNRDTIQNLINECIHRKIHLIIKGRIKVHLETHDSFYINIINFDYINDEKNTLEYLDAVYGIRCLLPIQGAEHNANYISNRIIETITMGYVAVTNNELSSKYYKSVYYNDDIRKILDYIDTIHNNKTLWCKTMRRQIDEALDSMYGYRNISKIMEFVKKISIQGNFITTSKYVKATYKIWFSSLGKTNRFFKPIDNLKDALIIKHDYIVTHDNYDIFLAEQIIKQLDYEIYVDETHFDRASIESLCLKYNKIYKIKTLLKMYCLISSQRAGSTLIIDYIQKSGDRIMCLSEIFNDEYPEHYDIKNKNGVLYGYTITPLTVTDKLEEYMNQFREIAEYNGKEGIFFKWTLDFLKKDLFSKNKTLFDSIVTRLSSYNIIYLSRDVGESILSKKLAELNNSYSNIPYKILLSRKEIKEEDVNTFNKNTDLLNSMYLLQFKKKNH